MRHLLRAHDKTVINIYYHDENSQENLINNITEIIGEAEVMEKVRLIDQHNTERGILIPKEN